MVIGFFQAEERLVSRRIERVRAQRSYGAQPVPHRGEVRNPRMLRFEINELALVVEILVEHGKCLRLGRLRQLRSDMAPQALDALFERLLANGAEEVVEQLTQLWTDDQVAGGVQLELAVDLGALEGGGQLRHDLRCRAGRCALGRTGGSEVGGGRRCGCFCHRRHGGFGPGDKEAQAQRDGQRQQKDGSAHGLAFR